MRRHVFILMRVTFFAHSLVAYAHVSDVIREVPFAAFATDITGYSAFRIRNYGCTVVRIWDIRLSSCQSVAAALY